MTSVTPNINVSADTLVSATKEQVSTSVGNSMVILSLANGMYYGLNEVGQDIWAIVQKPTRVSEICDAILSMYDVSPSVCERDVRLLIAQLYEHELISLHDAA